MIGLSNKIYNETFKTNIAPSIEKKTWEVRYTELNSFITKNNRLPFSSGVAIEEIILYRWFKVQVQKTKNGELNGEMLNLINEVLKKKVKLSKRNSI